MACWCEFAKRKDARYLGDYAGASVVGFYRPKNERRPESYGWGSYPPVPPTFIGCAGINGDGVHKRIATAITDANPCDHFEHMAAFKLWGDVMPFAISRDGRIHDHAAHSALRGNGSIDIEGLPWRGGVNAYLSCRRHREIDGLYCSIALRSLFSDIRRWIGENLQINALRSKSNVPQRGIRAILLIKAQKVFLI